MDKYKKLVDELNTGIEEFNKYLASKVQVCSIPFNELCLVAGRSWEEPFWPNKDYAGVYFLFAKCENGSEVGVYIGKASLSRKIGHRIYSHLKPYRDSVNYQKNDRFGNIYIIEYVYGIEFESNNLTFMVPALEEYLISTLRNKVKLLNTNGN